MSEPIVLSSSENSDDSNDMGDLPNINLPSSSNSQMENIGSSSDISQPIQTSIENRKRTQEERVIFKQNNKIYKPGECMKHMYVEMHPVLLEAWFCADVSREVSAVGAHIRTSSALCDPALVLWTRNVEPSLMNVQGVVELSASKERCDRGLYICQAEELAPHVQSHNLASHLSVASNLAGCKLTLVVFGVKNYFKKSGRKTNNSSRKLMTEIDLEMAITDTLVSSQIDTVVVDTPNDLALTIVQFTKAIAEAPYKKMKRSFDEQAAFYMQGDNKKCVPVDKDGNGVNRLWQQMVAILPLSSLETSRAICAKYGTPRALYEALQTPSGLSDLADVRVSRAAGVPGSRARRVGPELANKLHALLTADDGNFLVV